MLDLNEQYLIDKDGKRTAVVIPITKFEELQQRLDLQDDEPDCEDATQAICEGLLDVKTDQTVSMKDMLDALRD
jgi:hypothetical protein